MSNSAMHFTIFLTCVCVCVRECELAMFENVVAVAFRDALDMFVTYDIS